MGVRERREREREQARDTILAAARTLMREVGPQAMSLREVARRAEYSPATLYEYFKDKDDIFQALFREGFQRFGEALRAVPTEQPTVTRLRSLGHAYVNFADANPEHYKVMFGEPIPGFCPTDEAAAEANETFQILLRCIAAGVADGSFHAMNDEEVLIAAATTWSLLHGFVTLAHANRFGGQGVTPDLIDMVIGHLLVGLTR